MSVTQKHRSLIKKGLRVLGSVRSEHDAERLRSVDIEDAVPLIFDVTDAESVALARRKVQDELGEQPLFGLVSNAGSGTAAPLLHMPIAEFRHQLEANVIGTLNVIQYFAPLLHTAGTKPGRIINIGSTAGRIGIPLWCLHVIQARRHRSIRIAASRASNSWN